MSKAERVFIVGQPYFVLQEGHKGSQCFYDDACYRHYLLRLTHSLGYFHVNLHAYVLLPNEIQLLLTAETPTGISRLMQRVGGAYVQYYNNRFDRSGSLWKGRFKSSLIQSNRYFCACQKYIELAPLRSGLARLPGQHPWSSYCSNAFGGTGRLLSWHAQFENPGEVPGRRYQRYREFIASGFSKPKFDYLDCRLRFGHALMERDFKPKSGRIRKMCRYRTIPDTNCADAAFAA
jgi:putative transposase